MTCNRTLICLATYNESDNVEGIHGLIRQVAADADILFVDDNSPDGTGRIIDQLCANDIRTHVLHRSFKSGIGSAHLDGIRWAYKRGYDSLITMDCDFAHSPAHIPAFIENAANADLVVGTRFVLGDSLSEWSRGRKFLTHFGHILTRGLLGLPFDATGAYRLYALNRINPTVFSLITAHDYAFFFQSMHILYLNGIKISEIPISLPARVYGTSKMKLIDVVRGFARLLKQAFMGRFCRNIFVLPKSDGTMSREAKEAWEAYWSTTRAGTGIPKQLYGLFATVYRNVIIRPNFNHFMAKHIKPHSFLLHAGCGGGEVDMDAVGAYHIIAYDISANALRRYGDLHKRQAALVNGDLMTLALADGSVDGVYNLGVMEHFSKDEIDRMLREFHRVLRPSGKLILFWPPRFGISVRALKLAHFVLNNIFKRNIRLHPAEPMLLSSKRQAERILNDAGFEMTDFYFGMRDLYTQAVVVGAPRSRQ